MWYLIKAEIDREKYIWCIACLPLIATIPILYIYGETWLVHDQASKIVTNVGKGLAIVIALLTLRVFLSFMIINPVTRLHMRPPVPIIQLGIVRVFNIAGILFCSLFLITLNILALKIDVFMYLSMHLLWGIGILLFVLSLMLILSDLLSISTRIPNYHGHTALLLAFTGAILLGPYYKPYMHHFLNWPMAIALNIVGISLLFSSVYTFSRLRTYIIKMTK